MKLQKLLLVTGLSLGVSLSLEAQINNAINPEINVSPAMNNTGLAIAPNVDLQAAAIADGSGSWRIYWIDGPTGLVVDSDGGLGFDPDVAYYANADAVVLAYDNLGVVYVNDYYLTTLVPTPNYTLNTATAIAPGTHANIDMNSLGRGLVCWENAGQVWASAFTIGTFAPGPPVLIGTGTMPDAITLDDGNTAAITFVDPGGNLVIEIFDFNALFVGIHTPWAIWNSPSMSVGYRSPRIASQRNSLFGSPKDFAVVAQDWNGFTDEVHAFFAPGAALSAGPVVVNSAFAACPTVDPYPVIAFNRNRVDIAWSQNYLGACSGLWQTMPNLEDDVLLRRYSATGTPSPTYLEVNFNQSNFSGNSKTSLSTEYDGNYLITNANWHEGVLFQDPMTLFWKQRNSGTPSFINEQNTISEDRANNFSLVSSPVDQTIEVLSESDDEAHFQLLDNAGRTVELKNVSNIDNTYNIDISHLSGGMYFLYCSSNAGEEVIRVLQVTK